MNSFYTEEELKTLGLKSFGENVLISKKTSIYGASNISIGNNVRIDDFCILSGNITLKDNIHISAGVYLYGGVEGIYMEDHTGISAKSIIYAVSDDFVEGTMIGVMSPPECRKIINGKVLIKKYAQIGAGTIVLPNVILDEGVIVGAMCLVNKNLESWTVNTGIPAKKFRTRKNAKIELEKTNEKI